MVRRTITRAVATTAAVAFSAFLAADGAAQESTTRGFNLGFYLEGAQLTVEDGDPAGGGGGGLRIGYGLNRIITLHANFDGMSFNVEDPDAPNGDWVMAHVDLGARFHLANALRSWVPYGEVSFTTRAVSLNDAEVNGQNAGDLTFNGGALTLGAGIAFYLKQNLALDLSLLGSAGTFSSITVDAGTLNIPDIEANSGRFKIGILWWKN